MWTTTRTPRSIIIPRDLYRARNKSQQHLCLQKTTAIKVALACLCTETRGTLLEHFKCVCRKLKKSPCKNIIISVLSIKLSLVVKVVVVVVVVKNSLPATLNYKSVYSFFSFLVTYQETSSLLTYFPKPYTSCKCSLSCRKIKIF